MTALVSSSSARAAGLRELGADEIVSDIAQLRGRFDLILESVGGETLGRLVTLVDPQGTLVMFGNSSNGPTCFNVRDIDLDAAIRLQGFELFFGGDPFGRDLGFLAALVADASSILSSVLSCPGRTSPWRWIGYGIATWPGRSPSRSANPRVER